MSTRTRPRWTLLPLAALLGGCVANMPTLPNLPNIQIPGAATTGNTVAPTQRAPAAAVPLLTTRNPASMQSLFAKGTVTGLDLVGELKAVRQLTAGGGSGAALQQLMGSAGAAAAAPGGGGLFDNLFGGGGTGGVGNAILAAGIKTGVAVLESALREAVVSLVVSELSGHLDFLIGDTAALQAETITLPAAQGLTPQQMQRAVTLGAVVIATRLSAKVLKRAQQDLATLDQEYATLIERREKAATLLQQALGSGLPASARASFTEADLSYLRGLSGSMGVREFAQDMGAQNLALRLVAATDPKAFAEYRAQSEGLSQRQKAAVRSVAGVVAFGGLLATVGGEIAKIGKEQPLAELLAFGPLMLAFVTEVPPVLQSVGGIVVGGMDTLVRSTRTFRVSVGAKTEEVGNAAEVFDRLAKNGATAELQRALFRDASRGLLHHVHACDPRTAGQMLDTAVPAEQRTAFARELQLPEAERFNFVNGFVGGAGMPGNLAEELLGQDHRPRLADRRPAMTAVQLAVAGRSAPDDGSAKPGFLRWNNEQLMRLVFVNRDGSAAQFAALEIQGVTVRPVPSMQSLYAYEQLADACRAQFAPPKVQTSAPARPAPATRPARPPAAPATPPKKP